MAGQIHALVERILVERSRGNPTLASTTRTKLILKGIDPDRFNSQSPDDPGMLARVRQVAGELNVNTQDR